MSGYRFIVLLAAAGCASASVPDVGRDISRVNGSVEVGVGESFDDISTVNGAIQVGDRASIGRAHTVNGRITLGAATAAQSLRTVNGAISMGPDARVNGDVHTTNGTIHLASGTHLSGMVTATNGSIELDSAADVAGHVANVNGRIDLEGAHVGSGIESVSGTIDLGPHSRVEGGIWIRGTRSSCESNLLRAIVRWLSPAFCEPPLVVIGPDVVVQGTLRFEHAVRLYVNTRARIGPVDGATAISFSGEQPPI